LNRPIGPVDELMDNHVEKLIPLLEQVTAAHITRDVMVANKAMTNIVTPSERIRKFLVTVVGSETLFFNDTRQE
jgi:hypothetical protein